VHALRADDSASTLTAFDIDVLCATFEVVARNVVVLETFHFDTVVVDQLQLIRVADSKLCTELRRIKCRRHLLLFTDENETLASHFQVVARLLSIEGAHRDVRARIARHVNTRVNRIQLRVGRSALQRSVRDTLSRDMDVVEPPSASDLLQLRKCDNHPYLLASVDDDDGAALVESSGEIHVVDNLLARLGKAAASERRRRRVLVCTQMARMADIFEDVLKLRKLPYSRVGGMASATDAVQRLSGGANEQEQFSIVIATSRCCLPH
jgi:hypothetical protein